MNRYNLKSLRSFLHVIKRPSEFVEHAACQEWLNATENFSKTIAVVKGYEGTDVCIVRDMSRMRVDIPAGIGTWSLKWKPNRKGFSLLRESGVSYKQKFFTYGDTGIRAWVSRSPGLPGFCSRSCGIAERTDARTHQEKERLTPMHWWGKEPSRDFKLPN